MAAGSSQRLRPLTEHIPKTLLMLGEKQMLAHILDNVRNAGIDHVDIVTGHGHPAVEEFANEYQGKHPEININLIYNDEYDSSGNIVSFFKAKEVFDEDFLLINSDTIFHADILTKLIESPHTHAMVVDSSKELGEEEMKVLLAEQEHIAHIHKSLDPQDSHGEYIGVMKLGKDIKQQLLSSLQATIDRDNSLYYEDALQNMINTHGVQIHPIDTEGLPSMEIDTHEDFAEAKKLLDQMD